MSLKKKWRSSQVSSVDLASTYLDRIVAQEQRGPGDFDPALRRIGQKTGVGYWTLWGLWNRRRKSADLDLIGRLRTFYLDLCERQIGKLEQELAAEVARGDGDAFSDLANEVAALREKLAAARAATEVRVDG